VLSKCSRQFSLCLALGYVVFVFNHWILFFGLAYANMWVCKLGFNVSGLCRSKLGCSGQDPQGSGFKPPSILWVHVVCLIFGSFESFVVSCFSYCHFMLCFSMLHYGNFHQNIDLKPHFFFNLKLIALISNSLSLKLLMRSMVSPINFITCFLALLSNLTS